MNFKLMLLSTVVSAFAFAGENAVRPAAPMARPMPAAGSRGGIPEPKLACPAGTRQAGGQNSVREASFCVRLDDQGRPIAHGPYLALHPNGKKAVEGQYVDGKRSGVWVSFDQAGARIEEVAFENDLYQGLRTQWVNGKKSIEENYVAGKKQGQQTTWDAMGKATVVMFADDRPVAK